MILRLPLELRMVIYEDVLLLRYRNQVQIVTKQGARPELTQTCRAIRQETIRIWLQNDFQITFFDYDTSDGEAWYKMMDTHFEDEDIRSEHTIGMEWPDCWVGTDKNLMRLMEQGWNGESHFLSWMDKEQEKENKKKLRRKAMLRGDIKMKDLDSGSDEDSESEDEDEVIKRAYYRFTKLIEMMKELRETGLEWVQVKRTFEIAIDGLALLGEEVCTEDCCMN